MLSDKHSAVRRYRSEGTGVKKSEESVSEKAARKIIKSCRFLFLWRMLGSSLKTDLNTNERVIREILAREENEVKISTVTGWRSFKGR